MGDVEELRDRAARCRRLARESIDRQTVDALTALAVEIEAALAGAEVAGQASAAPSISGAVGVPFATTGDEDLATAVPKLE